MNEMSESKAFYAAALATLVLLGAIFGVSTLMRRTSASAADTDAYASPSASAGLPAAHASPAAAAGPEGKALFAANCASCHGDSGEGGYGPSLRKRARPVAQIAAVVTRGVPNKMPAYAGKITPAQIQAVAAYAASLGGKQH